MLAKNLLLDRTCDTCKDRQFFRNAYGYCLCCDERPEENTCTNWEGNNA